MGHEQLKKGKWWLFLVTTSATSVVFLDNTVMPVALPTIQKQLGFSDISLVWVVNAYLLALSALLLVGGRLSDIFGKRSLLVTGMTMFGAGSLISAVSMTQWWLIMGRVITGAGGALIVPTTGALIIATFPKGERAKAIGINTGISSIFLILGPAIGGLFTQYLSWRGIFYFNLPLVVFGIIMAYWLLHPSKRNHETFHFTGALMMLVAVVTLVIGLMQGNDWGWTSPLTLSLLLVSPIFFILFWWISTHTKHPIIDFHLFKNKLFSASCLFIFFTQVIIMVTVLWAIYFQNQLGFSPAFTGLIIFIAVLPVFLMAPFGGYLGDRYGPRPPLLIGFTLLTFSLFYLLATGGTESVYVLLPGLLAFGSGIPMIFSPTIAMALSQVKTEKLGAATGITTETRQLASTVGIAVMTAVYHITLEKTGSHAAGFSTISLVAGIIAALGLVTTFFAISKTAR